MMHLTLALQEIPGLVTDAIADRVSAVGASQIELELMFSKYQLIPTLREDFMTDFGPELEASDIPVDFGIDLLVQMHLHKRAYPEVMIGLLIHHFKDDPHPAQACADAIVKATEMDLCDAEYVTRTNELGEPYEAIQLVCRYEASKQAIQMTDRFQYPLPMIEPPLEVKNNRDTGYHTIRGSILLRKNHIEEDVCLDHINRVNSQRLAINPTIVAYVQNVWKGLDKPNKGEPIREFHKRRLAFQRYDRISRDVIDAMSGEQGFWLTHRYDKRGRTYSQGHHINYQGNDWNKAVIEFADKETLNGE